MTRPAHVIRLRGPWEHRLVARTSPPAGGPPGTGTSELPPSGWVVMPADWNATLGPSFCGRVAYHRRFGRPTGLGPADRVDLVIDGVDASGSVRLNGESLGEIPLGWQVWRCDVTARLRPRNELIVEVERTPVIDGKPPIPRPGRDGLPGRLMGDVRLEIFIL
ncbi:MAG TPA: hypothetical protein PLF81_10260 [Candidatus Anammoximicrobium sp.]|nr:hypothetical protein [Candidatus Anammoximicrobium sp.]